MQRYEEVQNIMTEGMFSALLFDTSHILLFTAFFNQHTLSLQEIYQPNATTVPTTPQP